MPALLALLALSCLGALLVPALAGEPLTQELNVRVRRLGEYVLGAKANDAQQVFFTYTEYAEGSNAGETGLYQASSDSPITYSEESLKGYRVCPQLSGVSNLVFSAPHGALLFTAVNSEGLSSIYYMDQTLECHEISDFPVDLGYLQVSPDGSKIAFAAEVFVNEESANHQDDPLQYAADELKRIEGRSYKAFTYTRLYMRHWDDASSAYPDQWRHVFVCPLQYDVDEGFLRLSSSSCSDVMQGLEGDSPMKPFGDASSYTFSHDGTRIAFVTQLGLDNALQTNDSVYIANLTAFLNKESDYLTCLTCWNMARDAQPQWSSDDSQIFYLSMDEPVCESDLPRLRSQASTDYTEVGDARPASVRDYSSGTVDFPIDQYILRRDETGAEVEAYLACSDHARGTVLRLKLSEYSGSPLKPLRMTYEGSASSLAISDSTLYMLHSSYTHPTELYMLDLDGPLSPEEQEALGYTFAPDDDVETVIHEMHFLVELNSDLLADIDLPEPEEFYIAMPQTGDYVQSWYFPPRGLRPTETKPTYPLILYIHGGPESPWSTAWSFRWNPQIIAGQGYAVVATNYHGSSSFGLKFSQAIRGEWFSHPVDDVFAAWHHVLQQYPYIDPARVGAMGASFGATFINWLNGHTRNITCFITHDGVFDVYRNALETDELFFPLNEFGGSILVEEDFEKYTRWNPMLHAKNFRTPMLVIHGAHDYRISEYHGLALFNALQVRGVPSELLLFPTQNHWVYKPQESVFWMSKQLEWLERWLK